MPLKSPFFSFKHIRGLGDAIFYILHGPPLRWLTYGLLRIKEPCSQCSKRAIALNLLFPIPFWKLFFKSRQEMMDDLSKTLQTESFKVNISQESKSSLVKTPLKTQPEKENNFILIGSSENHIGDLLIKTQIYKK